MFSSCSYKVAVRDLATTSSFHAEGGRGDNKGEKGALLAKSIILLSLFSGSLPNTFFFLHLIGQTCVKQPSLSQGRLGNIFEFGSLLCQQNQALL